MMASKQFSLPVVDLFSCGGGMSAGFANFGDWKLAGAVDLEVAKPSGRAAGETGCNTVYQENHGITPLSEDLHKLDTQDLMKHVGVSKGQTGCLISCAPCTDFSRANPENHLADRKRNTLVGRSGDFVEALLPHVFTMENARELINGNHPQHWQGLKDRLEDLKYDVYAGIHKLTRFGLPQIRERALVIAARHSKAKGLEELWEGWEINPDSITVRSALSRLNEWLEENPDDPTGGVHPNVGDLLAKRLDATPRDGGSWVDVARNPETRHLCTPDCIRRWEAQKTGSHPDVYGRMWWDRPAPTIKRESAHVGNGRYTHPVENRLLTVREMATLQGFPFTYRFTTPAISNRYRTIGDAVPPLVARQIAAAAKWAIDGMKPDPAEWILPDTTLRLSDLKRVSGGPIVVKNAA